MRRSVTEGEACIRALVVEVTEVVVEGKYVLVIHQDENKTVPSSL